VVYIKIKKTNLNNPASHYNIKELQYNPIKLYYKYLNINLYNKIDSIKILIKLL